MIRLPPSFSSTLLLVGACAGTPEPARNSAPSFGEPLHRFTVGVPQIRADGSRLRNGSLDLDREKLMLGPEAWFESAPVEAGGPFDQFLMSWNVHVPTDAGVLLEVSVQGDGPWSPWLHLADWGDVEQAGPTTRYYERGTVQVDILHLEESMHRARYRIRAFGVQSGDPVVVHRTTLTFTSTRDLDMRFERRIPAAPAAVQLTVPALSQRDPPSDLSSRICSPTCVAMAMAHAGHPVSPTDVARLVFDEEHDIYGNWVRSVQGAFELGVPGVLVRLSSWDAVEHFLGQGMPLIVSVKVRLGELTGAPYGNTPGHLLMITGLDGNGGVLVNDPAASTAQDVPRTYRLDELERVWMARGGVAYLIGR
jgi:hypothetical protein